MYGSRTARLLVLAALQSAACGTSDKAGSNSNGGGATGGNGGAGFAGTSGAGVGGSGSGAASALVGRFWGHLPDNGGPIVLEVPDVGSNSGVRARIWRNGDSKDTMLLNGVSRWSFFGERIADCASLSLDASRERVVLGCGRDGTDLLVLRRSHATRIYEAPVKAAALGFDPGGSRFGFANGGHFWLWDSTAMRLNALGEGTALSGQLAGQPPVSLAFAPDGRRVSYLRGGASVSCKVASLMSFDITSGDSKELAKDALCAPGFALFSPDGKQLVYFANDAGDGSGADLLHWSFADGKAAVIGSKLKTSARAPYVVFGASGQRLLFGTSTFLAGPQPLSSYDFGTRQVNVLSAAAHDIVASSDGAFVAFNESNGQVSLWDDAADEMRVLFAKPDIAPDTFYRSGMSVSPNGRFFAFVTGYGDGRLYDTAALPNPGVSALGTTGLYCLPEYLVQTAATMRAAYFTPDSAGVLYFPKRMGRQSDCGGGTPDTSFRFRDLKVERELDGFPLGNFYRFGPHGEVVSFNLTRVTSWSPERGAVPVLEVAPENGPWLGFEATFARDAAELLIELRDNKPSTALWAWNATTMSSTQIAPALATSGFSYRVDSRSGQVVFVDASVERPLSLWTADGARLKLLDRVDTELPSDSGRSIAVHGARGDDQGIFTFRFGESEPKVVEEGTMLGISDSHIYYQAPDGVCVLAY